MESFLSRLSEESFKNRVPVVAYLTSVSVVGCVGNVIVLLVYWLRFKPSATRVFVLAMALCDLVTNTIGLPLQIATIRYAYDIDGYWLCRGFFAFATLSTQASGCLLVLVALDRCNRICRPLKKQLDSYKGLLLSVGTVAFFVVVFAPFVPLYGIHRINTTEPAIQARMCWYEDDYKGTVYGLAFKIIVSVVFFVGVFAMAVSYLLIGLRLWKRKRQPLDYSKRKLDAEKMSADDRSASKTTSSSACPGSQQAVCGPVPSGDTASCSSAHPRAATAPCPHTGYLDGAGAETEHVQPKTGVGRSCTDSQDEDEVESNAGRSCTDSQDEDKGESNEGESNAGHIGNVRKVSSPFSPKETEMQKTPEKSDPATTGQHGKSRISSSQVKLNLDDDSCRSASDSGSKDVSQTTTVTSCVEANPAVMSSQPSVPGGKGKDSKLTRCPVSSRTQRMRSRTTLMMSVLTLFYIINWLPHLVMRNIRSDPVNWCDDFVNCGWNTYAIVIRSYYLNSAVNAFVYSFCNARFRQEFRELFVGWARKFRCH